MDWLGLGGVRVALHRIGIACELLQVFGRLLLNWELLAGVGGLARAGNWLEVRGLHLKIHLPRIQARLIVRLLLLLKLRLKLGLRIKDGHHLRLLRVLAGQLLLVRLACALLEIRFDLHGR